MYLIYGIQKSGLSIVNYFENKKIKFKMWDDNPIVRKAIKKNYNKDYFFKNSVSWQEIPRDDEAFFEFLREVTSLLSQERIPSPGHSCTHCNYLREASGYENHIHDIAI